MSQRYSLPRRLLLAAAATACAVAPLAAQAQAQADFPTKPITLVIPFPPAGSTDVLGRLLAQAMAKALGQNVLIENVGGAGGTIGSARVARATGDGYTLLFNNMSQSSAPALYAKLPFDPLGDFETIGPVAEVPMILVGRKTLPQDRLDAVLAFAKANPAKLNVANAGVGATSQLCEVLLKSVTQSNWTSVPYKGTGPALNDLLGGTVDLTCDQPASTLGHIKSGALKPIAVAHKTRLASLPQVPTFAESGLPGFELAVWHGLYAPKGTPKAVVDKLNQALRVALKDPTVVTRFAEMSAQIPPTDGQTPEALRQLLGSDINRWKTTLRAAGIQPE